MRILLVVLLFAFAGFLAVDIEPSATSRAAVSLPARTTIPKPAPETVEVAFVRKGWVVRVQRIVPKGAAAAEYALRELTQGPTRVERRKGMRTALPDGARLRSLRAGAETWFASFSRSTLAAGSAETKRMRLWQIAATLAPHGDKEHAVLATEGRFVTTLRLGVRPGSWRAETGENDYHYVTRGVRVRLAELGYLDARDIGADDGYLTEQALMAFQGWEDLDRTGTVTGQTQLALFRATRPRPAGRRPGRRIEIYRDLRRAAHGRGRRGRARRAYLDRVRRDHAGGRLQGLREGSLFLVGAVPGVDAVRGVLPRWNRDAPVVRRPVLPRVARLRAVAGGRGRSRLPVRGGWDAGLGSLTVDTVTGRNGPMPRRRPARARRGGVRRGGGRRERSG